MQDNHNGGIDLNSMVLKFEKRRYDGGSEIELIQYIENCNRYNAAQGNNQQVMSQPMNPQMMQEPMVHSVPQQQQVQGQGESRSLAGTVQQFGANEKASRSRQVLETLALGPMEIAVGSVGILTSGLAIVTFSQMNNPEMAEQSKAVLKECTSTLLKGFVDTLWSPVKALKVAVVG